MLALHLFTEFVYQTTNARNMKFPFLILTFLMASYQIGAQENAIQKTLEYDDTDIYIFMSMMGFDYQKWTFSHDNSPYVNVYIDEYLNDELIEHYDHFEANSESTPAAYFDMIFTKLDTSEFTLKMYTHSVNDSIEQLRFRIGELGLYRKLKVNKKDFDYSWKNALQDYSSSEYPPMEEKIPLMYYSTAVNEEVESGNEVNAFCEVPNILKNRHLIENKGKIEHYFEIGLVLAKKVK